MVFAIAVAALPIAAQDKAGAEVPGGTAVFAPIVSRLQGELRNNLVRLSWVDSPDVRGPVYLYRSTLPFEALAPFPGGSSVEIPYGAESYVDEIEAGGTLYYFIAASDEMGRRYDIPIALNNTISIQITADSSVFPVSAPRSSAEARQNRRPTPGTPAESYTGRTSAPVSPFRISSLEAEVQGEKVIITFNAEPTAISAVLYRSVQPIKTTQDLLGSVIIQAKASSPFTDYPVPGIPYYYAVIGEEELIRGTMEIIPGRNATLGPAQISIGRGSASSERNIRAMPLPQISVQAAVPGMNAYTGTPPPVELSPQAAKALGNLPALPASVPALKKPRVFARDLAVSPAGGEEYALSVIVKNSFAAKNWEAARDELIRFLALPRSPEAEARAGFYLGQCYYFLRQPREGLFRFLAIQNWYPTEAREWIQASLDMLKEVPQTRSAGF